MEPDNLQSIWQSQEIAMHQKTIDKAYLDQATMKIKDSHKRLKRKLFLEIFIGLAIYIGAGLILFYIQAGKKEILFALKIMLLTGLYAIPSILLLYKSISKLNNADYSIPLKGHLKKSVGNLKKSLRVYLLTGLLACVFILIALLTDAFFLSQSLWLKAAGIAYIILMAVLLSPILKYHYGREIKTLQQQLNELEKV